MSQIEKTSKKKQPINVTVEDALAEGITPLTFERRWKILTFLCLSLLTVMIANMSLNMALPALARDLALTQLQLTWAVEAYSLVFAGLLFLASAIADRYGRKRIMQFGLAIFMLASLYAGIWASNGAELIISRVVMGIGGAFVMPTTLSIINVVFPSIERARAIAIWSAVSGVGMMFGSVLTGLLLEFFDWEIAFLFGGMLSLIAVVVNHFVIPESKDEKETPIDWFGGLFVTLGLIGIVYAIMEAPSEGIDSNIVLTALIGGIVSLIIFVWQQYRSDNPLLDMKLFRRPEFGLSALAVTLTFFAMMGAFFGMSQVFQLVMGYGVFLSSIAFFPVMLPMMFLGPMVPRIVEKIGTKWTIAPGLMIVALGFLYMSGWTASMTYSEFLIGMGIVMVGMALVMAPATNMMMAAVPKNRSGMGSAMNDTTREFGGSLGIAVLGSMISSGFYRNIQEAIDNLPTPLPPEAMEFAQSSLAGSLAVSEKLGDAGAIFSQAAKEAFMAGNSSAMFVSAIIAIATTVLVVIFMPNKDGYVLTETPESELSESELVEPDVTK